MIDDCMNKVGAKHGSQLPQSKLTEEDVIEMRRLHREKTESINDLNELFGAAGLAKRYGVHVRTIEKALHGYTWSHIL